MPRTVVGIVAGFGAGFGGGAGCRPRPLWAKTPIGALIDSDNVSVSTDAMSFLLRYIFVPSSSMKFNSNFSTIKMNYNFAAV
jgi:hypothetical protein